MSEGSTHGARFGAAIAAGAGAFVLALALYMLISGFGGGVSWSERWSFDQYGHLELEGVFIGVGLGAAIILAAPLGAAVGSLLAGGVRPLRTALLTAALAGVLVFLVLRIVPQGRSDPAIAPYFVWSAIFLAGLAAQMLATRGSNSDDRAGSEDDLVSRMRPDQLR